MQFQVVVGVSILYGFKNFEMILHGVGDPPSKTYLKLIGHIDTLYSMIRAGHIEISRQLLFWNAP